MDKSKPEEQTITKKPVESMLPGELGELGGGGVSEPKGYWWCANCQQSVDGAAVTFAERHDQRAGGCGYSVYWHESDTPPPTDLRPEIASLRAENDALREWVALVSGGLVGAAATGQLNKDAALGWAAWASRWIDHPFLQAAKAQHDAAHARLEEK